MKERGSLYSIHHTVEDAPMRSAAKHRLLFQALAAFCILTLLASFTFAAEEWVTPDGKVAIQVPPAKEFVKQANTPPPGLVRWYSTDGTRVIVVVQAGNPANVALEKAGLEEGFLKQMQPGKIVSSTATPVSGIPAFTIVARGKLAGFDNYIYAAQEIVAFSGQCYKLMISSPNDPTLDPELSPILKSMRVADPAPIVPIASRPQAANSIRDNHDLSVRMAQIGIWILIAAGIAYFFKKKRQSQ